MSFVTKDLAKLFNENSKIDDVFDRAHRTFTVLFLAVCCLIIGTKQYVGKSIECYVADKGAPSDYAKSYCWAASTYQVLPDANNPYDPFRHYQQTGDNGAMIGSRNGDTKGTMMFVSYYQWVPMVLCLQAILFYIPYLFWRNISKVSGLHLPLLLKGARDLSFVQKNGNARRFYLTDVAIIFHGFLKQNKRLSFVPRVPSLVLWFAVSKILYLANVGFQLGCLHQFLQTSIVTHGVDLFNEFIFNLQWSSSIRFPIRTICEYKGIPQMNNYLVHHTTHCVLPINLYNDKIYGVIASLFLLLTIFTIVSMIHWIYLLALDDHDALFHGIQDRRFLDHLGLDGRLVLLLVSRNIGLITAEALIEAAYKKWTEEEARSARRDSPESIVSASSGPPRYNGGINHKKSVDTSV